MHKWNPRKQPHVNWNEWHEFSVFMWHSWKDLFGFKENDIKSTCGQASVR